MLELELLTLNAPPDKFLVIVKVFVFPITIEPEVEDRDIEPGYLSSLT